MINVYLDVDGVLNQFPYHPLDEHLWEDTTDKFVLRYRIAYSPTLISEINALAARPDVQFHWLTTWCNSAKTDLAPALGINDADWPVVGLYQYNNRRSTISSWWKLPAIMEHVFKTEPDSFVWIDDDIKISSEAEDWLVERDDALAVSPFTDEGITPAQLEIIKEFINE